MIVNGAEPVATINGWAVTWDNRFVTQTLANESQDSLITHTYTAYVTGGPVGLTILGQAMIRATTW